MRRAAAEMTKYAANAALATRISFINQVANICDELGIDVNDVRRGIGSDSRIGFQFLYPGAGYGGSCFPKDVQGLVYVAKRAGVTADLLESVHQVNVRQRQVIFNKIVARFGKDLSKCTFAIWGVAFKPKTDDIREAPAVVLIEKLIEAGAALRLMTPRHWSISSIASASGSATARTFTRPSTVPTHWPSSPSGTSFRSPDFQHMRTRMRHPVIFDGRNLYSLDTMRKHQFEYYGIGRSTVRPA